MFKKLTICALLMATAIFPGIGRAQDTLPAPVADPGFSYVDVNDNGFYNEGVDLPVNLSTILTANNGTFDTQKSIPANGTFPGYTHPAKPASLVIPSSVTIDFTGNGPVMLKAGHSMGIHGVISGDSVSLSAYGNGYHVTPPATFTQTPVAPVTPSAFTPAGVIGVLCHTGGGGTPPTPGSIDLSGGEIDSYGAITLEAGGDIRLDGAYLTGDNPWIDETTINPVIPSIKIAAGGTLYGDIYTELAPAYHATGTVILGGGKGVFMNGASIGNDSSTDYVIIQSAGDINLINNCAINGAGPVLIKSTAGAVKINGDLGTSETATGAAIGGTSVTISAATDVDLTGTAINCEGNLNITARGKLAAFDANIPAHVAPVISTSDTSGAPVITTSSVHAFCTGGGTGSNSGYIAPTVSGSLPVSALYSIITAGTVKVCVNGSVDLRGSSIVTTVGDIYIQTCTDSLSVTWMSANSTGGVILKSHDDLAFDNSIIVANNLISVNASEGSVNGTGSQILTGTDNTTAAISVYGAWQLTANDTNWSVPKSILLRSAGSIYAQNATLAATGAPGTVKFNSGAGYIDVTDKHFTGIVSYIPNWATVIGR